MATSFIRKAETRDIDKILAIYEYARHTMRESGNMTQWADGHPHRELLESDISIGQLYVLDDGSTLHAVFALIGGEDPTYGKIYDGKWRSAASYHTIHRIAAGGTLPHSSDICFDWCKTQDSHLRIDTHESNAPMRHVLQKNGFEYCGVIHLANGDPRIAFEYIAE